MFYLLSVSVSETTMFPSVVSDHEDIRIKNPDCVVFIDETSVMNGHNFVPSLE